MNDWRSSPFANGCAFTLLPGAAERSCRVQLWALPDGDWWASCCATSRRGLSLNYFDSGKIGGQGAADCLDWAQQLLDRSQLPALDTAAVRGQLAV